LVHGLFLDKPEKALRESLASQPIERVEHGLGGRSVAFRITLADGTRGYYKPEQSFSAAHWYAELAAYYLDRELRLGRTPPAVGRRLSWKDLRSHVGSDEPVEEVIIEKDGTVRGAFIGWVGGTLQPIRPPSRWERWLRVRGWPTHAVTPFQRPAVYMDLLAGKEGGRVDSPRWYGADAGVSADKTPTTSKSSDSKTKEPANPDLIPALSDMIVFDYLTLNLDRWGGEFTNVRTKEKDGPLIFLDNGAGFSLGQATNGMMRSRLHAVEKFRRATIDAVRNLNLDALKKRMNSDPLAPLLPPFAFTQLEERRQHVLSHVAAMTDKYGEAAVYPW